MAQTILFQIMQDLLMDQKGQIDINNGFIDLILWWNLIQISVFWITVKQ